MTKRTKLPKFYGRTPRLKFNFLRGRFGEAVDKEVKQRYTDTIAATDEIGEHFDVHKRIYGTNPFYVVAVNEVIRPYGLWTMGVRDFRFLEYWQTIEHEVDLKDLAPRKSYPIDISQHLVDVALVLKSHCGINSYLTGKLVGDDFQLGRKNQWTIDLNQLTLQKDENSPYGLSFEMLNGGRQDYKDYSEIKSRGSSLARLCVNERMLLDSTLGLSMTPRSGRIVIVGLK